MQSSLKYNTAVLVSITFVYLVIPTSVYQNDNFNLFLREFFFRKGYWRTSGNFLPWHVLLIYYNLVLKCNLPDGERFIAEYVMVTIVQESNLGHSAYIQARVYCSKEIKMYNLKYRMFLKFRLGFEWGGEQTVHNAALDARADRGYFDSLTFWCVAWFVSAI